jgi:serine protease Do
LSALALLGTTASAALADAPTRQGWQTGSDQAREHVVQTRAGDIAKFADVVERVKAAVIAVRTKAAADPEPESLPPQLRGQRHGRPSSPGLPGGSPRAATQGSGVFITADGYAVTNRNVVDGRNVAEVETDDNKVFQAKIVGTDPLSDLALLKVDGGDFAHATLAEREPRVGDWILAFGNPLGLGVAVTAGIVSGRERSIGTNSYEDLIQIDAPINQGDAGGPTFDLDGNVIGVNTTMLSPTGGSIGIGFATPADTVRTVVAQIRDKGFVTRGWLGVRVQPLTADIADSLGFKQTHGALVAEAQPDSPAANGGIRSGDVIVSLNGEPIQDPHRLTKRVSSTAPGTPVAIGVFRRGNETTVAVTLGELPMKDKAGGK